MFMSMFMCEFCHACLNLQDMETKADTIVDSETDLGHNTKIDLDIDIDLDTDTDTNTNTVIDKDTNMGMGNLNIHYTKN